MMKSLAIYDISGLIHTGENSGDYRIKGFSVAGVKFFLQRFLPRYAQGVQALVMFDAGGARANDTGYKDNRPHTPEIYAQLDWLYEELLRSNVAAYRVRGYEADDLIHAAVNQFRSEFSSIKVFSGDYDLTHNVWSNVDFCAINSLVNNVTMQTFEHAINPKVPIMYNSILAYKIFCKDVSDSVKTFRTESGVQGLEIYNQYCRFVKENFDPVDQHVAARNRKVLEYFVNNLDVLSEVDRTTLYKRMDLIFPKEWNGQPFVTSSYSPSNNDALLKLANTCGELKQLRVVNKGQYNLSPEELDEFRQKSYEIVSGEYSAKKGLKVNNPPVANSSVLNLRSFT